MSLLSWHWADLYIPDDPAQAWFKERPGSRAVLPVPPASVDEVAALRERLDARGTMAPFALEWGEPPERLRVKPLQTACNAPLFICRRPIGVPRPMGELGFPAPIVERLLSRPVPPGLILFLGPQASGKTTSAGCFCVEHVSRHGGIVATVEAPIEMPLEGPHGSGMILQTEIDDEAQMGAALRGLLRTGAAQFYCGEVTRDEVAAEATAIGATGGSVVLTYHAQSLSGGLRRYAEAAGGRHAMLADSLAAAFFLTLEDTAPQGQGGDGSSAGPRASRLVVTPLLVLGDDEQAAGKIRAHIRNNAYEALSSEIERQERLFMSGRR